MTLSCLKATMEVLVTSTVVVEVMSTASSVDATIKGFLDPSLPKHAGNTDYVEIKEHHQLLMENTVSVDSDIFRENNVYLGIIFPPDQY